MKEDQGETKFRTGNGQLKAGYNVQRGTENGFVVGYDIFPKATDTRTLKPDLKKQKRRLGSKPKTGIADAGYGSEEHYQYLENRGTVAVITYGMYHQEQSRKWKTEPWKTGNR
jgi:transposase